VARSSDLAAPTSERRRVLYLITNDISARFLRGQLGYLIEHGFDVEVGTRLSDPPAEFDDGVVVHDLPYEREPSPIADLRALVATIRLIRRLRPDVVNASTPKAGLLGTIAGWLARVPQRAYVVRGLRFETLTGRRRTVLRWLERLATACATDVVYNSTSLLDVAEAEHAVRRGRGRVLGAGSGNGIDIARYADLPSRTTARAALGLRPDVKVIGFVGRLTRDKGIVDLVEAFSEVADDATLLLVGDFEDADPVPDEVRRTIAESPRIVHMPWVDETRRVYPAMDVLAFPSYREGLPNVPLEAQLCGIPVVAYAATGTVDAVVRGHGNRLVPLGDVAALSVALGSSPEDPEGSSGWVAEQFGSDRVWSRLNDLYEGGARVTGSRGPTNRHGARRSSEQPVLPAARQWVLAKLPRSAWRTRYRWTRYRYRLRLAAEDPAIAVCTAGKTGSSSVIRTLERERISVVQIHELDAGAVDRNEADRLRLQPRFLPHHLWASQYYGDRIRDGRLSRLITLTRDPLAQDLSMFFQTAERRGHLAAVRQLDVDGQLDALSTRFVQLHDHAVILDWHAAELHRHAGIDVYDHPFTPGRPNWIVAGDVTLLVLRTEDLAQCGAIALTELCGRDIGHLEHANIGASKRYGELYERFVASVDLPCWLIDAAYSSKYARHFYQPNEIERFRARWSRQ
jgi:glycosyltransferase involved in cell wall biosynthesis